VPELAIANQIYQEIIPRELTYGTQIMMAQQTAWYVSPEGRLDMRKLLAEFQEFFREHSEHWVERFDYKEAGPQLLLQAFLQRVVNGGGRIEREYGLGRGRTDLLVIWPWTADAANSQSWPGRPADANRPPPSVQRIVLELKLWRKGLHRTLAEGLAQTVEYMDRCGASEGHLILFDRRRDVSWTEKIFCREERHQERAITVWGM
jgi:hypothetical protein